MTDSHDDLTPTEIRRIRYKLGLSQVEAGELLGGGPRAFTKYEGGTIKPSASTANMLRLLDANPMALVTLAGDKSVPIESGDTRLFEVTGKHIAALSPRRFSLLMRRLLDAEALSGDLPMDGIHVAANITAADAGEDARIEWKGGPERTKFVPNRLTQFQLKAGPISPAEAGADVLTQAGDVQPLVRDVLERGGVYVMACARSYENKLIQARINSIHNSITKAGLAIAAEKIQFRDADQIASWVNVLPPVAAWVLEQTQPGLVGPFKDWTHWAGRFDSSPWVPDPRLPEFRARLRGLVAKPGEATRVVGLSGVGKSRLVHEALGPTDEEGDAPRLSDLVLYAVESEVGPVAVKNIVQSLVDSAFRAIVVVDRCPADSHNDLVGMVKRTGGRVSLVTVDHEIPPGARQHNDTLIVELASDAVVEGMIKQIAPDLPSEDHRRLVKFSRGFPQMANLLGQAWLKGSSIATATDDDLFDRIILGRKPSDEALLKEAGMLLGAFRLLGIKDNLKDLEHVAPFSRARSPQDLRAAIDELQQRGVVQQHGRLVSLQPKPLAMALAERQWRQWPQERWDEVLAGKLPDKLRERAADQLAMLNDRPIAMEVARHITRYNGPFASLEGLSNEGNADVVSALSEIDAEALVTLLERILKPLTTEDLKKVDGDTRRNLVRALEKIAFLEETFERGALLMLDLAVSENETWSNNATGDFKALFPVFLSSTVASAEHRVRLLDDLVRENDPQRMPIVVDALLEACNTHSTRIVGPEIHGSRPVLEPWRPKYWKDAWNYIVACMNQVALLAVHDDALGAQARAGMAQNFRTLIGLGLLDHVEEWVAKIRVPYQYWPEALNSLGDVLLYDRDRLKPDEEARLRALVEALSPQDLASRVHFIVTEMPWDYPMDQTLSYDERAQRQIEAVEELGRELLQRPGEMQKLLPELSTGDHRMIVQLGVAIAKFAEQPLEWEKPIVDAFTATNAGARNFGLLAGYYAGLANREPTAVEAFKTKAVQSPVFAITFPFICQQIGITTTDVELACQGLRAGIIPVRSIACWSHGGVFTKLDAPSVTHLFDQLFEMDADAYSIALDLMGMYVHNELNRLEALRPQLLMSVAHVQKRPKSRGSQMDAHHFQRMLTWLLKKGRDDADARAAAIALAKSLAENPDADARDFITPLLPIILSEFAPMVWPLFGQAIVKDRARAWHVEHVLGDSFTFAEENKPPIINVPSDILFSWAHASLDAGPAFLARVLPLLTTKKTDAPERAFHPLVVRLLNDFGERDDVRRSLVQNMHSFGWSGSLTTYYALYEQPLRSLSEHPIGAVRRWARVTLKEMRAQKDVAKADDDEQDAQWNA